MEPFHRLSANVPESDWADVQDLARRYHAGNRTAAIIGAIRFAKQLRAAGEAGQLVVRREDGTEQIVMFL